MTSNCPKCGTRWTSNTQRYMSEGRNVIKFRCQSCGHTATQRLRQKKQELWVAIITEQWVEGEVLHEGNKAFGPFKSKEEANKWYEDQHWKDKASYLCAEFLEINGKVVEH